MLFTSWPFLLGFLPIALFGYGIASRHDPRWAKGWLVLASLAFYGFWDPYLIILISLSVLFNYGCSLAIRNPAANGSRKLNTLRFGIITNLIVLFYYKYFYSIIAFAFGHGLIHSMGGLSPIVLPLGISFFTFTQIGYLVDCHDGVSKDNSFIEYVLFVTFFPHLIAGPILHNGEMVPQFADNRRYGLKAWNLAPGLTMFALGMVKKSLIADSFSPTVSAGFYNIHHISLADAWISALSYSLQLYFDFSGYSDMAIGLAMLFNVRFPPNFNSPYKARNIVDFWQRWHMSLTRYLTQYVYNPIAMWQRRRRIARGLPMTRKALGTPQAFTAMVAGPTIATMSLAGIWHGAGVQYFVFGLLHGVYLSIFHAWKQFGPKPERVPAPVSKGRQFVMMAGSVALTYFAVLLGQIFFRSSSVHDAVGLLTAMAGGHDGSTWHLGQSRPEYIILVAKIVGAFALCWLAPNSQQIMAESHPILGPPPPATERLRWQPTPAWSLVTVVLVVAGLFSISDTSEFLYFKF